MKSTWTRFSAKFYKKMSKPYFSNTYFYYFILCILKFYKKNLLDNIIPLLVYVGAPQLFKQHYNRMTNKFTLWLIYVIEICFRLKYMFFFAPQCIFLETK